MPRIRTEIAIEQVDAYLERCGEDSTAPRVSELADELGVSRITLSRRFQETAGIALSVYFSEWRNDHAAELLADSDLTAYAVAAKAGFGTARNFHRAFARIFGTTPATFRRTRQDAAVDIVQTSV